MILKKLVHACRSHDLAFDGICGNSGASMYGNSLFNYCEIIINDDNCERTIL